MSYENEKTYTVSEIKAYARHWLKPALCTDAKNNVPENERLQAFMHYIDADDRDNIENFLKRRYVDLDSSCGP
ncbi:MAG: hypothetical protein ACYDG6_11400 [Thermincolia bacterium]